MKATLRSISVSSDGTTCLAVGDGEVILRSGDGLNWERVFPKPLLAWNLRSCFLSADGRLGWAVGENGAVLRSVDGAKTWQQMPNLSMEYNLQAVAFSPDGQHGWSAGDNGSCFLQTTPARHGSGSEASRGPRPSSSTFLPDAKHGWVVGDYGAITGLPTADEAGERKQMFPRMNISTLRIYSRWAPRLGWGRLRRHPAQHGWGQKLGSGEGGAHIGGHYSMAAAPDGGQLWAAGDFGTILSSVDGGATWQRSGGPPTESTIDSLAFSAHARRVLAVGISGTILRSVDEARPG